MAFELEKVVPWGRNLSEYTAMFRLTGADLNHHIISFGDGPASFNAEMSEQNRRVVSADPLYMFSGEEIKQRIGETRETVLEQARANENNFVWKNIRNVDDLEQVRMAAMARFLEDYEAGRAEGRYICHELPDSTGYADLSFDLGLSSHFLLMYSLLGLDFHVRSISEMLRVCMEVRIFPVLNLNAEKSEVLDDVVRYFKQDFAVSIEPVEYEFQKGGNRMLVITRK